MPNSLTGNLKFFEFEVYGRNGYPDKIFSPIATLELITLPSLKLVSRNGRKEKIAMAAKVWKIHTVEFKKHGFMPL